MADQNKELPQWLERVEYLKLSQAAEIMGYPVDVLLHLGVRGELEIRAPVLMPGDYEWDIASARLPRKVGADTPPLTARFDYRDRVVLFANDLARIEALGSVFLRRFYSPEVTVELADKLVTEETDLCLFRSVPDLSEVIVSKGMTVPWFGFDGADDPDALFSSTTADPPQDVLVTLDHLWISGTEFRRFVDEQPQDDATKERVCAEKKSDQFRRENATNARRHAGKREQVLLAALACIYNAYPENLPKTAVSLATLVDQKGGVFWSNGEPPLARDTIERLLSPAMRFPGKPEWEGGKES